MLRLSTSQTVVIDDANLQVAAEAADEVKPLPPVAAIFASPPIEDAMVGDRSGRELLKILWNVIDMTRVEDDFPICLIRRLQVAHERHCLVHRFLNAASDYNPWI